MGAKEHTGSGLDAVLEAWHAARGVRERGSPVEVAVLAEGEVVFADTLPGRAALERFTELMRAQGYGDHVPHLSDPCPYDVLFSRDGFALAPR